MVANKHWHWWDISHRWARWTSHGLFDSIGFFHKHVQYVPLPQSLTAQTIPHSSQHTYASMPDVRRSAATEGVYLEQI
jgi:hypothetical protein